MRRLQSVYAATVGLRFSKVTSEIAGIMKVFRRVEIEPHFLGSEPIVCLCWEGQSRPVVKIHVVEL